MISFEVYQKLSEKSKESTAFISESSLHYLFWLYARGLGLTTQHPSYCLASISDSFRMWASRWSRKRFYYSSQHILHPTLAILKEPKKNPAVPIHSLHS